MDNAQVMARDGSFFLFADWQGMTRIALPSDRVKTDCNLDRPHQDRPLVLRPNGLVWSAYALDVDPATLKKVRPESPGHESPDPLGGPDLVVAIRGEEVSVRGSTLKLEASGDELHLGGVDGRRERRGTRQYDVRPDGSLIVFGYVEEQTQASLVVRAPDGAGRVAWCRRVARAPQGSPSAFRELGSTWLADRDLVHDVGYLVEIQDDGAVTSERSTRAIAGPWVLDGRVWWQPESATLCAGARLGEPEESFTLSPEDAGPGRLLRVPGRRLFLPWHGVSFVDLAPAKKGKGDISRKHRAADEPMYREAERLLRPIREGMARRGVRVFWKGCTRSGKSIEPRASITGRSDVVTYLLGLALQYGARAKLEAHGVTSVGFSGGNSYDDILASSAPCSEQDVRDLVAMLDAAGLSRASGFGALHSLAEAAAERKASLPLTPEAEDLALAAVLSGLRFEGSGPIPPATADAFAAVAPVLADHNRSWKAGIAAVDAALFVTVAGHRRFGAEAVAPVRDALVAMNPIYADRVSKALQGAPGMA